MSNWSTISKKYNTFLIDLVGVIHDGLNPFPEVIKTLNQLPTDKRLVFVSNNPRPHQLAQKKVESFGLTREFQIITSGDYTRTQVQADPTSLYYHWGAERNKDILENISLPLTQDIEKAEKVLLTAYLEEHEDPNQYNALIDRIVARQLPVFCANPDVYALEGQSLRKCAGFFVEKIQQKGGEVTHWGKPAKPFYEFVAHNVPGLEKSSCLMIGDTLNTDIQGAHDFGIDSLLVLSGISELMRQKHGISMKEMIRPIEPTHIAKFLGA